jgi:valyl-tRNA synthetase
VILSEDKVRSMRNFANKVWNIGRFIYMNLPVQSSKFKVQNYNSKLKIIKQLTEEFKEEKRKYLKFMDNYRFSQALGLIYEFLWHRLADYYIEELKEEIGNGNIRVLEEVKEVYLRNLAFLHPVMPFVTEAIWQVFKSKNSSILLERLKS